MSDLSRRRMLGASAAAVGAASLPVACSTTQADHHAPPAIDLNKPAATKGNIRHSIVKWCFSGAGVKPHYTLDQLCSLGKKLGVKSIELLGVDEFATVKKHGLTCAIANNGMPGAPFIKGLNNPAYQPEVLERTSKVIEACAAADIPSTIAFTGFAFKDVTDPNKGVIDPDDGATHCVNALKKLAKLGESHGVTINLEHLNSRVDDHPMKGHPGYAGDQVDYCFDIIRRVGSPRVKLLFDIYHVQIMDGDIIKRIHDNAELIGHIHTAGNPGRDELDEQQQEINYPACMHALVEAKYDGYVGHEFIPTRDPAKGLWAAVHMCDV